MPGTAQGPSGKEEQHHNVFPVLLHQHVSFFTGLSMGSTPAASASLAKDVALRARLKVKEDRLCLILTYDPNNQLPSTPLSTPTKQRRTSTYLERSPNRQASKLNRRSSGSPPINLKAKKASSTSRRGGGKPASSSPTPLHDPHRHPRQYYVIELHDISPLAAQLPLSAELRARLHLNMVDVEDVTYSSHSTPRATALSMGSGGSPSTMHANFYFPPSRGQPVMSQRKRQESPSANFAAMTAPAVYGQYLSAEEPYKVHTRSLHTPREKDGQSSRQGGSSVLGEGDFTMIHKSHTSSQRSSASASPLLTPQKERHLATQASFSEGNSAREDASTPQMLRSPTIKLDTLTDCSELLLVAIFGVATSAGVADLSFSTDPRGEVMVEKKPKKLGTRTWQKSLFKWFVPWRSADSLPRRSASALSAISGVFSSSSTGSPQSSPTPPNAPSTLPAATARRIKASSTPAPSSKHAASIPVSAAAAHVDPKKVLELPFTLNKNETFHLRFLSEEDLRAFLARYVELQTRLREAAAAKAGKDREDASSPLWHPRVRQPRTGGSRFDDDEGEDDEECEAEENVEGTASTASFNDYPRHSDALGGNTGINDDPLSSNTPNRQESARRRGEGDRSGVEVNARTVMPPMAFFRSRGWEDYLRYHLDPRFGVAFAAVPLYLWNSFLPLAKLVLYTCYRGFLIVERVAEETAPSDEDASKTASFADLNDSERMVEVGRQRLNALVNRLLTPIRTAQNPPRHPPRTALNRHGVVEVLPVGPRPLGDERRPGEDVFSSSGNTSWDAVKLVLPSTDEAKGERNNDHFTTVKDVFLCLSESHLLFLNSFGHLRFQCSLDEIALITHSAATANFPTYPFFRFRLKSSDFLSAPTFVLTFTLLPEAPHEMLASSMFNFQAAHHGRQHTQEHKPSRSSSSSTSSSSAGHAHSDATTTTTNTDSKDNSSSTIRMLGEEEKGRLLHRHEEFLRIFAAVCPRPLERRTFAEMLAGEMGRSNRIRFSHLTSAPRHKVSGSPLTQGGLAQVPERGTSWMAQNFNAHPILCVKVEADDIELYDTEVSVAATRRSSAVVSTLTQSNTTSSRQRDTSLRRRSKAGTSPMTCFKYPSRAVTPRWGFEDPGIVLQDAGRDMDFSLEVAVRTMPLLASKEEVHAEYGSNLASQQMSLHLGSEENTAVVDSEGRTKGAADDFVPMAPKKKKSIILHRTALQ